jgi:RNA polymerase sigma factor (sigma-70 family)
MDKVNIEKMIKVDNLNKFEELWENSDVRNIMNKVSNLYKKNIDFDDIESIKMDTLWNCIKQYDEKRGTKFTSFVYQRLSYAYKSFLKTKNPTNDVKTLSCETFYTEPIDKNQLDQMEVFDIITGLDEETKTLLNQKYYQNLTMAEIGNRNGYSRETARRKISNAVEKCRILSS